MSALVKPSVTALERLLHQRRQCANAMLNLDMMDRWAGGEAAAKASRDYGPVAEEHRALTAAIEERVAELRSADPAAVEQWVDAHVRLLDRFIDSDLSSYSMADTARYVAREEREAWREVAAGERAFVDQNIYYVRRDPVLFEALFGFAP